MTIISKCFSIGGIGTPDLGYCGFTHKQKDVDYSKMYFTIVATMPSTSFNIKAPSGGFSISSDNGQTWSEQYGEISVTATHAGDKFLLKGNIFLNIEGNTAASGSSGGGTGNFITSTMPYEIEGNIMSLVHDYNFQEDTSLPDSGFVGLFKNSSCLVSAENLVLPTLTLSTDCYKEMFSGCVDLVKAPKLPATTLAENCYALMFSECRRLEKAPDLLASDLSYGCYFSMFYECDCLNYIKMTATTLGSDDLSSWTYGVDVLGTFVKSVYMTDLEEGPNGIPSGWTIIDVQTDPPVELPQD